jgi:hypothetical protein
MKSKSYVKQLEERTEELQDIVTDAVGWVPAWLCDEFGTWYYKSAHHHYGTIHPIAKGMFQITFTNRTEVIVSENIQDAKDCVEKLAKKLRA